MQVPRSTANIKHRMKCCYGNVNEEANYSVLLTKNTNRIHRTPQLILAVHRQSYLPCADYVFETNFERRDVIHWTASVDCTD